MMSEFYHFRQLTEVLVKTGQRQRMKPVYKLLMLKLVTDKYWMWIDENDPWRNG